MPLKTKVSTALWLLGLGTVQTVQYSSSFRVFWFIRVNTSQCFPRLWMLLSFQTGSTDNFWLWNWRGYVSSQLVILPTTNGLLATLVFLQMWMFWWHTSWFCFRFRTFYCLPCVGRTRSDKC